MRTFKVSGIEHQVYDHEGELPEDFHYIDNWRDAEMGDWVKADDECYIQVLREGRLKRPGKQKPVKYIGTCTGTFVCRDTVTMDTERRANIYSFSGKHPEDSVKTRARLTVRERLFALFVSQGMEHIEAYSKAFHSKSKDYAKGSAALLLKQERIRTAMKTELKPVLEKLNIDSSFVLSGIKDIASSGEKDSDKLKALFELADILGLKETQKEITAIGGAVFKGFLPEDAEVIEDRKELLGEGDA